MKYDASAGVSLPDADTGIERMVSLRELTAAVLAEREACAEVCDRIATTRYEVASRGDEAAAYEADWTRDIAKAIRARGVK